MAIGSAALLPESSCGLADETRVVEAAGRRALAGEELTPNLGGTAGTGAVGDAVLATLDG